MELGLQIPIASGIPDSMICFPDSKTQYFGFHEQNLHGGINYAKLLHLGKWWLALLNLMHACFNVYHERLLFTRKALFKELKGLGLSRPSTK